MPATGDVPVEREGADDSNVHYTAEGKRCLELGLLEIELDLTNVTEDRHVKFPACSEQYTGLDFQPTLPPSLPPSLPVLSPHVGPAASALPPLSPGSPATHPQPIICVVDSPRFCQFPSASWLEDPSSPPPASESWTPPRPFDPAAPLRLSAPSSPSLPVDPPAPPGSIIPPAPPWLVVVPPSPQDSTPSATPRRSVPPAPLGSSLPPVLPQSAVAPGPLRPSGSPPPPRLPEPWAPPWTFGSSVSPWIFGSPSRAPPPPAPPPSVGLMESLAIPPPWLLPPSAPPWTIFMAAIWVSPGSSCSGFLLSPPWLNPPIRPTLDTSVSSLTQSSVTTLDSHSGVRPPPKPPPTLNFLLPAHVHSFVLLSSSVGGVLSDPLNCSVLVLPLSHPR
ncbi:Filamentous hemagglutinin [Labeo rohita]|uniref:Filamentous hemagglutinin n=1 Tax=Labeo rohita TaxID=84645 RepID=A0ABQ8L248_LABRO|nr:Filamentous hemagglutinin [Labeo rohita]